MLIKVKGTTNAERLSGLCKRYYGCADGEYEIVNDLNQYRIKVFHTRPHDAAIYVWVAKDNMSATGVFMPAINGGGTPTFDEAFAEAFMTTNVNTEVIDKELFRNAYQLMLSNILVDNHLVAVGREPEHGRDGEIKLFFNPATDKPNVVEEKNVNFREINKFVNVKAETLLARRILPTEGRPGVTLTGSVIPQIKGKDTNVLPGQNVRVSSDATEYYASIDGHVVLKNNTISVHPIIEIKGNVDFSVGNIDFVGDVHISGDVFSGFTVKGQNIVVTGVCFNATLKATKNIEVKSGVKSSKIYSDGTITVGYSENSFLQAKKDIKITKYSFNSTLQTNGKLIADDRTTVTGGSVTAFQGGAFYNVGTKANVNITISVGRKFDLNDIVMAINDEKRNLTISITKISNVLNGLYKGGRQINDPKVLKLAETRDLMQEKIVKLNEELNVVMKESMFDDPAITINNTIEQGVTLLFFDKTLKLKESFRRVRFFINKGSLRIDYMYI